MRRKLFVAGLGVLVKTSAPPAQTRRHSHGKFPPPREGKIGINAAARKNCSKRCRRTGVAPAADLEVPALRRGLPRLNERGRTWSGYKFARMETGATPVLRLNA